MKYNVELKPKAIKDGKNITQKNIHKIFERLEILSDDLQGDIKKLTNFSPEFRLRIGDYRVLFETEENKIIIYRILHRKDVCK